MATTTPHHPIDEVHARVTDHAETTTQAPTDEPQSGEAPARRRSRPPAGGSRPPRGRAGLVTHSWARRIHVYTSMVALLIVLFFGITGLTLNHPDWTFGDEETVSTYSGDLPFDAVTTDGTVDYLAVSEYLRSEYGVNGSVDDYSAGNGEGTISYANPGYSASVFFDLEDNSFDLTVTQQGFVQVLNDLHKGRDAGSAWSWVIDIAAGFLVVISLTGLMIQLFLRKRRRSALVTAAGGALVVIVLTFLTLR